MSSQCFFGTEIGGSDAKGTLLELSPLPIDEKIAAVPTMANVVATTAASVSPVSDLGSVQSRFGNQPLLKKS